MKLITRFLYLPAACIVLLASCAKEQTESYDKFEDQALEAYMTQKHKDLLENYQTDGGYYVDIIKLSDKADPKPVNDTICWVKFDFSGRDLSGNIALTRRAAEAYQLGTFTKYTHYVPYYRYCGEANAGLIEGTYLAMRNTLHLGEEYARNKGIDREYLLRDGDVVRLYMPSRVVGSGGISGDGGYEGQYSLSAKRPLIMEMEIVGIDKNPLEAEGSLVDAFAKENGGMVMFTKDGEDGSEKRRPIPGTESTPITVPNGGFRPATPWRSSMSMSSTIRSRRGKEISFRSISAMRRVRSATSLIMSVSSPITAPIWKKRSPRR